MKRDLDYTSSQMFFDKNSFQFWTNEEAPILVGMGIRSPENMGMLIRLAGTIGCRKVIFAHESPLHNENKIRRTSSTGHKVVDWELCNLEEWKLQIPDGYEFIAIETTSDAQMLYTTNLPSKAVYIVGDERYGIDKATLDKCQKHLFIPLSGPVKSMNVVSAAAVVLFELVRQKLQNL